MKKLLFASLLALIGHQLSAQNTAEFVENYLLMNGQQLNTSTLTRDIGDASCKTTIGFKSQTRNCGTCKVTGVQAFYRIYEIGATPGADKIINLGESKAAASTVSTCRDSVWQTAAEIPLSAFPNGHYGLEFYFETVGVGCSVNAVKSSAYTTTFRISPFIKVQPIDLVNCTGGEMLFKTDATGTGTITYQWQQNDGGKGFVNLAATSRYQDVTTKTLKIKGIINDNNDDFFRCIITDASGCSITTREAKPTVLNSLPIPTTPSNNVCEGGKVEITAGSTLNNPLSYQWQYQPNSTGNYQNINENNIFSGTTTTVLKISETNPIYTKFRVQGTFAAITSGDNGQPENGTCITISSIRTLTLTPRPTISVGSVDAFCQGGTTFNLPFSNVTNANQYSLTSNITGFTAIDKQTLGSSPIVVTIPETTAAGTYTVNLKINNSTTTCESLPIPVSIRIKPPTVITENLIKEPVACEGSAFVFQVKVTGENLTYQWFKGGTAITGVTLSTLTLNQVIPTDAGKYYCEINGECGMVTSATSDLTVKPAPIISQQPRNVKICEQSNATFKIAATGSGILTYQWKKNGVNVGENSTSLTLSNLTNADNGSQISCDVISECGILSSSKAILTVVAFPALPTVTSPIGYCENSTATALSAGTADGNELLWWGNDATGGSRSAVAPIPSTKTAGASTFYVSQRTYGNCEGGRAAINVIISKSLTAKISTTQTAVCSTGELNRTAELTANVSGGESPFTFKWSKDGVIISNAINTGLTVNNGGNYSVNVRSGYCSVDTSSTVKSLFPELANAPTANDMTICSQSDATLTAISDNTGGGFRWYDNQSGSTVSSTDNPLTLKALTSGQIIYAVYQKTDGTISCETPRKKVTVTVGLPLVITSQPANITKCKGNAATFTAAITNATNYQWERKLPGGNFEPIAGETTNSLKISSAGLTANPHLTVYRASASGTGCTIMSNEAILRVNSKDANLESISVCAGSNATFSVPATTGVIESYQWQKRTGSSGAWEDILGKTSAAIIIENTTPADDNVYFRCRLTFSNGDGSTCIITTDDARLTVKPATNITSAPVNSTICEGTTFNFEVKATGDGTLTYQWFKSGKLIDGATSAKLPFTTISPTNAGNYNVRITGGCGVVSTDSVNLIVKSATVITQQPQNAKSCEGTSATFEIKATGSGTLSYQWKKNGVNVGGNSSTLVLSNLINADNGSSITCDVMSECKTVISTKTVLTVVPLPALPTVVSPIGYCESSVATALSAGKATANELLWWENEATGGSSSAIAPLPLTTVVGSSTFYVSQRTVEGCEGGRAAINVVISKSLTATISATQTAVCSTGELNRTANFTAKISGGEKPFSFQWLKDGVVISNATDSVLVVNSGGNYLIQTRSGYCSADASFTLKSLFPELNDAPIVNDVTVCSQSDATLTAISINTNGGIRWYDSPNGSTVVSTGNPLILSNISSSRTLYAVYQKTDGTTSCETPRKKVVVTVGLPLVITSQPANITKCKGNAATFTVAITNATNYQWERKLPGGNFEAIPGETGSSLKIASAGSVTSPHLTTYRIAASGTGCTILSGEAILRVNSKDANLESISVCVGSNATFAVPATTGVIESYQWQKRIGSSGAWEDVAGKTTPTIIIENTTAADDNVYFRCRLVFSNGDGSTCIITTDDARLTVKPATNITSAPVNAIVCEGTPFAFETKATGDGTLAYQWFTRGKIIDGATSAKLNFVTVSPANAGNYSVRVTGGCGIVSTDSVSLTVKPATVITQQPQNSKVCEKGTAMFEVKATGSGTLSYQWKKNGNNVGENSNALALSNLTNVDNGAFITCDVMSECKTLTSAKAVLTVVPLPVSPTVISPIGYCENSTVTALSAGKAVGNELLWWGNDATGGNSSTVAPIPSTKIVGSSTFYVSQRTIEGCEGGRAAINVVVSKSLTAMISATQNAVCSTGELNRTANFTAKISGGEKPFSFQWLKDGVAISNVTDSTLMVDFGGSYSVNVRSGYCSADAGFTLKALFPELTTAPTATDVTICSQSDATLTAISANTGGGIRWYDTPTGSAVLSTDNPLVLSNLASGRILYAVYQKTDGTNSCETPRKKVIVTVGLPLVITSQPVNQTKCKGNTATFSTTITNAINYQWERKLPGGNFEPIPGETTNTLKISSAGSTTNPHLATYRVAASGTGCTIMSNEAILRVNSKDANLESISVCAGSNATFTVPATTGVIESYQWQKRTGSSGAWEDVPEKITKDILIENTTSSDDNVYFRCRLVFSNGDGSTCIITTDDARLTVKPATNITSFPVNSVVCEGTAFAFEVKATGDGTLTYQWSKSGKLIEGATSAKLNFTAVSPTNAGNYNVRVTGGCGIVSTDSVSLMVKPATVISQQPQNAKSCERASATFEVKATGSGTLSFQWKKNGINIGENSNTLLLGNLIKADNGASITCDVLSECKTVASAKAILTVIPLPALPTVISPIGYCENYTATALTAGKANGNELLWWGNDVTGGSSSSVATVPLTTAIGSSTFYVSQRTVESCEGGRAAINVIVSKNLTATINTIQTAVCSTGELNRSAKFTSTIVGGESPFSFQWSKDGAVIPNVGDSVLTVNSGGNYSVNVRSGYCSANATVSLKSLFPELTTAPTADDVTVCSQSNATLTAISANTGGGIRWYDTPTGLTVLSTDNPLVLSNLSSGRTLYTAYQKTDGTASCETPRKKVIVTVGLPLVITSQPVNQTKCKGNTATFSTTITNAINYQWERKLPGGNFEAMPGETANSLKISSAGATASPHLTAYRVSASGTGCIILSDEAVLQVNSKDANLESISVCAGSNATFTVPATTGVIESYQWQKRTGSSGAWEDIAGKIDKSIKIESTVSADDNTYFRCRLAFSNGDGSTCIITTDDARLTVKAVSLTVIKTDIKCFGQTTGKLVATATGGTTPYGYQLGETTFVPSGTYPNLMAGTYKINVKDAAGCTATIETTITEPPLLEISEITTTPATCEGAIGSISIKATGGMGKLTYSLNGGSFVENSIFEKLTGGQFTVTVKDENGCTISKTATVEGKTLPIITTQPVDLTNCSGNSLTFSITALNVATYQWQRQLPEGEFQNISGENNASLKLSNVGNAVNPHGSNFRVILKNPDCEVVSKTVKLNANSVSGNEPDKILCSGSDFTFDLSKYIVVGNVASYQWQYRVGTSGSWTDLAGKTEKAFTLNAVKITHNGFYRCKLTFTSTSGTCLIYNESGSGVKLTIIENAAPKITSSQTVLCGTSAINLTATGCVGTVVWSNAKKGTTLTVSEAGTYSAKCNFENCDGLSSNEIVIIKGETPAVPTIEVNKTALCNDEKATLTATNCNGIVTWSNSQSGSSIEVSQSGSYSVTCRTECGVSVISNKVVITTDKTPTPGKIEGVTATNCVGFNPLTTVNIESPLGSGYKLQWQQKTSKTDWVNIAGAASLTYNPGVLNDTTSYRRQVSSVCGIAFSNVITYNIVPDPVVTISVSKPLICANEVFTLNANIVGGSGSCPITWQQNDRSAAPTSTFWNTIKGNSETITISDLTNSLAEKKTYYFRAIVDCQPTSCNKATALAVGVDVQPSADVKLNFTDSTICENSSVKLIATGCGGTINWSYGETTAIITVSPKITTTYEVTCSAICGSSVKSATVSVRESVGLPQNTTPSGVIIPQTLTFSAVGTNLKWYSSATVRTATLTAPTHSAVGTYSVWVTQTLGGCESNRLKITASVYTPLQLTSQSANEYDCKGNSVDFKVAAQGVGKITYQWQRKKPNANEFVNLESNGEGIKNFNLAGLNVSAVGNDNNPHLTRYRCIVRDSLTSIVSNEMTLYVNSLKGAYDNAGACVGANYEVNLKELFVITGDVASYQWQRRPGTSGPWENVPANERTSGGNTESLKITSLKAEDGLYYRCSVTFKTGGFSCTETTDYAKLTVGAYPDAPQPFSVNYCQGEKPKTLTFKTAASNDAFWFTSENQTVGDKKAPVPNTETTGQTTYFISEKTGQGCESKKSAVTVTVNPEPTVPTSTTPAFVKEGTPLKFSANGMNLKWFTTATTRTFTTESPVYNDPKAYKLYVSQTSEFGCESDRLLIESIIRDALAFKKAPVSQADCDGNSVIFETDAKGWGDLTYQWQIKQPNDASFTNLTGETAKKLTVKNVGEGNNVTGTQYRCQIKDADDILTSGPASLIVNKIEGTIPNVSLCAGQRIQLDSTKLKVSGLVSAFEWQRQSGSSWKTIDSTSTWLNLGIADSSKTADYRLKVIFKVNDKLTCNRYTKETNVVVNAIPTAPIVADFAVCKNDPKKLTVLPLNKKNKIYWFTSSTDSVASSVSPQNLSAVVGKQTVFFTERSDKNCDSKRMSVNFTVNALPEKPITDSLLAVCQFSSTAKLNAVSSGTILWSKNSTKDFQEEKPAIKTDVNGVQNFYVMTVNVNGCQSEIQKVVTTIQACVAAVTELPENDCKTLNRTNVNGKDWINFFDENGGLYISVNPDNQDLGTVTLNYRRYTNGIQTAGGTTLLSRYFNVNSSKKKIFERPVKIRFYATNEELTQLPIGDNWSVVRYEGLNEDCTPLNNDNFSNGRSEVIYENVVAKPYATGLSYVEFSTQQFSEFGFTANQFSNLVLSAEAIESAVQLRWNITSDAKPLRYFIERSTDGKSWFFWREIDTKNSQQITDVQPLSNKTYYRMVFQDIDGTIKVFPPVNVLIAGEKPACAVYPNPVISDGPINLYVRNLSPVSIEFYDVNLRKWGISTETTEPNNYRVTLSTALASGTYFVRIVDETGQSCVAKVVKR